MKLPKAVERRVLELAGEPTRGRKPPGPRRVAKLAAGWAVELSLPCVVRSELNQRDGWRARGGRFKVQAETLGAVLLEAGLHRWRPPLPVVVTLTRVGLQAMDEHDGLRSAFKGLVDALAAWLDVDDADPLVSWAYRQESGTPGVRVRIAGGTT